MALLKATSEYEGRLERSSAVIAQVVMSAGKWNYFRKYSTSFSVHVETLLSATIVGEGMTNICSSATIVVALRGGCGAADTWAGSTGLASATCGVGIKQSGLKAAVPKDREARSSARVAGEDG